MNAIDMRFPDNHQNIVDRFMAACQADERIVAAFLGGSYARNAADQFSDLDLYFITTDEAYEDFLAERGSFVRLLGEPLFLEDFGAINGYSMIYSNGSEAEIWFGRESKFKDIQGGSYRVLLDKKNVLAGEVFPQHVVDPAKQMETLRQQIDWFWHNLAHFIKAMGRRQLWFAYGQLELMRQECVNLARLRYDFSDAYVGEEPYFKVEQVLPIKQLSPLQVTYCPMEHKAMLQAALVLFRFYQDVAPTLAKQYGIRYQTELEQMMLSRLKELGDTGCG